MRKRIVIDVAVWSVLIALLVSAGGCTRVRLEEVEGPSGVIVDRLSIPLDGAAQLDARFEIPAGRFALGGGSTRALEGEVRRSRDWEPRTEYSVEASTGVLRVDQSTTTKFRPLSQETNDWDVRIASGIPTRLDVELGVGESTLDLRDVDVRHFNVVTGVGETTIDLSGERTEDVAARIEAGVGELTIKVPSNVGVRINRISEGIGEFSAEGLRKQGDDWVNDAYGTADAVIEITLHAGIGEVAIVEVP